VPQARAHLQRGNIAPVDLAQAAIGPGMAVRAMPKCSTPRAKHSRCVRPWRSSTRYSTRRWPSRRATSTPIVAGLETDVSWRGAAPFRPGRRPGRSAPNQFRRWQNALDARALSPVFRHLAADRDHSGGKSGRRVAPMLDRRRPSIAAGKSASRSSLASLCSAFAQVLG
jgi:hypothetical protein